MQSEQGRTYSLHDGNAEQEKNRGSEDVWSAERKVHVYVGFEIHRAMSSEMQLGLAAELACLRHQIQRPTRLPLNWELQRSDPKL